MASSAPHPERPAKPGTGAPTIGSDGLTDLPFGRKNTYRLGLSFSQNLFSGGLDWLPAERWRVSLSGNGQSSYYLTPANTGSRYGAYLVVNGEVAWRVQRHVEVAAQLKNIANRHYEYVWYDGTQALHSPADGRALYGSVRLTL